MCHWSFFKKNALKICKFILKIDLCSFSDIKCFPVTISDQLSSLLSDFDVLQLSSLQRHSVRKRDVQSQTHAERLLGFTALQRSILIPHVP